MGGKKKQKNVKSDVDHQEDPVGLTSDIADQVLQRVDEIEKEEEKIVTKARIVRDQLMKTKAGRQKLASWSREAEGGDSITRKRFIAVPSETEATQLEAFLLHLQQAGADMSNSVRSASDRTTAPTPPVSHCVYVWCPCRYSTRRGKNPVFSLSLSLSLSLTLSLV